MGMRTAVESVSGNNREIIASDSRRRRWLALDFFAGSGLVACGFNKFFRTVWANDICTKKAAVYCANHGNEKFTLADIRDVTGEKLPFAHLSWASFPCQDLSLAGLAGGIHANRSGLVWQWLRVMDEMTDRPRILVAENVLGLLSSAGGENYKVLHKSLVERGYNVGAIVLDAVKFVPQSRPRVFVIAVDKDVVLPEKLLDTGPNWLHPTAVTRISRGLDGWLWWYMPTPSRRQTSVQDIIEWDAPWDTEETRKRNVGMLSKRHKDILLVGKEPLIATGYKRTRGGRPVLELRFDGVAGCLRTPDGGSSRQLLVVKKDGKIKTRLLTVRETARLMGVPETFALPGSYNDGYRAMGDAVAVPVVTYLSQHLLAPLVGVAYEC
jgi:DNA (cytosine-5)-methyltransferase 1